MLKLILWRLTLICLITNYAVAQSSSNTNNYDPEKDEIVSKKVMKLVKHDLEDFEILRIKHKKLKSSLDSAVIESTRNLQQINLQLEILKMEKSGLINKIEKLEKEVLKSEGRTENYKLLANKKSAEAMKYKKYQSLAYFNIGELIVVEAIFLAVIFGVLHVSK